MLDTVDAILGGDYLAERRLMLAATTDRAAGTALFALNDIVLQKGDTGRLLAATAAVVGVTAVDIYATQQHMKLDDMGFDSETEPQTLTASVAIKADAEKLYS